MRVIDDDITPRDSRRSAASKNELERERNLKNFQRGNWTIAKQSI